MKSEVRPLTTVPEWLVIDAAMDKTVAMESSGGDSGAAALGLHIREVGWAQSRQHIRHGEGWGGWPPAEDHLEISLEPNEWSFVLDQLHRWAVAEDTVAQNPFRSEDERVVKRDSDAGTKKVADWISRSLAEAAR